MIMWIKIDTQLSLKPEVFQIAQNLQCSRAEVVGHLVSIWSWFDANSENGEVTGCCSMVDAISRENFAESMVSVNWLSCDENKIRLPNFDKHNGSSAKKRAMNQQRQSRHRNAKGNDSSVTETPLEKIRIEKKDNINYQAVVDSWNSVNEPKVTKLTEKRKTAIRLLVKEWGMTVINEVFAKIPTIPFLVGENERGWRADFDYALRSDKFLKLAEGGWDSVKTAKPATAFDEWK